MAMCSSYLALKADTITVTKLLLFTGNIPRGVFCERRSQKTRDMPREFMRLA